jgi:DNA processing protein
MLPNLVASKVNTLPPPDLAPDLQQIWLLITDQPSSFDRIVTQSQLAVATVSSVLLQLELLGLVTQLPGMRYQKSGS